jgi:organic radical activating enzyme
MKTKLKDRLDVHWDQNDPFGVQIEPVQGCTNFCSFCGIKAVAEKAFNRMKLMSLNTAREISIQMQQAGWGERRLVIAMAGEPTFHPQLLKIIRIFKMFNPKMHITLFTNGYKFSEDPAYVKELYDEGCNTILLDDYSFSRVEKIKEVFAELPEDVTITTYAETSPFHKHTKRYFITNKDHCEAGDGGHQRYSVCNVAANGGPPSRVKAERMCARPFRELVVLWDGRVVLCCADYRGVIVYGNVNEGMGKDKTGRSLYEIWHSPLMYAVRKLILHSGRRDLWPCCICDTQTMRNGLLPNNLGKKEFGQETFTLSDEELETCKDFVRRELSNHEQPGDHPVLAWEEELASSKEKYINPKYVQPWEKK